MLAQYLRIYCNKTTIITNAGGINPEGCFQGYRSFRHRAWGRAEDLYCLRYDILDRIGEFNEKGVAFTNMETEKISPW